MGALLAVSNRECLLKVSTLCAVLVSTAALAGCGEVSYKMGAGVDQLKADQQRCAAQHQEASSITACMREKGWRMWDVGSAETSPEISSQVSSESEPPAPVEAATASIPETPAPVPIDKNATAAVKPTPAKPPRPSSTEKVTVSSWWKPGNGNMGEAISACVTELGEDHRPDATNRVVSRGLLACMKKRGWYAL